MRICTDWLLPILADRVRLDPPAGVLTWLPRPDNEPHARKWNARHAGVKAGGLVGNGYVAVRLHVDGRPHRVYAHRLVWFITSGHPPESGIDHVNGDRTDNRPENLREADPSTNGRNMTVHRSNTSGVPGVAWNKARGLWYAYACAANRVRHLGSFADKADAAQASFAFREAHGFTNRNFEGVTV